MPVVASTAFRLQRVFAIAFAAFRARWAPMLVAAFLLSYLPAAAHDWFTPHYETATTSVEILHPPPPPPAAAAKTTSTAQLEDHAGHLGPSEMFLDAGPFVTWFPFEFLCGVALSGTITSLTASAAQQDRQPWRRAVRDTAVNLPLLILISLIVSTLVVVGAGLLLIPGLIVFAAWSVAGPAQIVERAGVLGALQRSAELTRRHRAVILGVVAMWLAAYLTVGVTSSLLSAALGFMNFGRWEGPALDAVGGLVYDLFIAALYLELRRAKDGVGLGEIDQVFA